jgi:flagellar hook-associated protein 2
MPVTMGGVASGMDTDSIIEKLVNVEAQPIKQMQRDIALNRNKKSALQTLSSTLKDLDKATRDLYGFRSAYDEKKVTSSDQSVLTAKPLRRLRRDFARLR